METPSGCSPVLPFLENDVGLQRREVTNNRKAGAALEDHSAPYERSGDARVNRQSRLASEDEWRSLGCAHPVQDQSSAALRREKPTKVYSDAGALLCTRTCCRKFAQSACFHAHEAIVYHHPHVPGVHHRHWHVRWFRFSKR